MKKQIQRLRRNGMSNLDIMKAKEIARRETQKMEAECVEKAFLYMLGVSVDVLAEVYWPKSAKKKIPGFINEVLSLFKSVEKGVVTEDDLLNSLREFAGVDLKREWYEAKKKYEDS